MPFYGPSLYLGTIKQSVTLPHSPRPEDNRGSPDPVCEEAG